MAKINPLRKVLVASSFPKNWGVKQETKGVNLEREIYIYIYIERERERRQKEFDLGRVSRHKKYERK